MWRDRRQIGKDRPRASTRERRAFSSSLLSSARAFMLSIAKGELSGKHADTEAVGPRVAPAPRSEATRCELVYLRFRSSHESTPQALANFGVRIPLGRRVIDD